MARKTMISALGSRTIEKKGTKAKPARIPKSSGNGGGRKTGGAGRKTGR